MEKPVFTWWRENRDKAPDLFEEELALTFSLLSTAPGVGKRYPHPGAQVRRVLSCGPRGITHYVDYVDHVLVVAVWGAVKGTGPDLSGV